VVSCNVFVLRVIGVRSGCVLFMLLVGVAFCALFVGVALSALLVGVDFCALLLGVLSFP
jgi:hypothetical protein